MMYKLLALFVVLTALFCVEARPTSDGPPPEFITCLMLNGVTSQPDMSQLGDSPDVPRDVQCTVKCYLQTVGVLKYGKIQMENALDYYDTFEGTREELTSALEECAAIGSDASCDTAMRIAVCLRKLG